MKLINTQQIKRNRRIEKETQHMTNKHRKLDHINKFESTSTHSSDVD